MSWLFNKLSSWVFSAVSSICGKFVDQLITPLSLSPAHFTELFGAGLNAYYAVFVAIGCVLSLCFFFTGLITVITKPTEAKTSPLKVAIRWGISVVLIFMLPNALNALIGYGDSALFAGDFSLSSFWDNTVIYVQDGGSHYDRNPSNDGSGSSLYAFNTEDVSDIDNLFDVLDSTEGLFSDDGEDNGSALGALLGIVIVILLGTQLIKYLFEILERYVMIWLMVYLTPLAAGTYASEENSCMKKWLQMFFSTLVVFFLNLAFLKVILLAMSTLTASDASDGLYLFRVTAVYAMIHFALGLDTFMGNFFTTHQTNGSIGSLLWHGITGLNQGIGMMRQAGRDLKGGLGKIGNGYKLGKGKYDEYKNKKQDQEQDKQSRADQSNRAQTEGSKDAGIQSPEQRKQAQQAAQSKADMKNGQQSSVNSSAFDKAYSDKKSEMDKAKADALYGNPEYSQNGKATEAGRQKMAEMDRQQLAGVASEADLSKKNADNGIGGADSKAAAAAYDQLAMDKASGMSKSQVQQAYNDYQAGHVPGVGNATEGDTMSQVHAAKMGGMSMTDSNYYTTGTSKDALGNDVQTASCHGGEVVMTQGSASSNHYAPDTLGGAGQTIDCSAGFDNEGNVSNQALVNHTGSRADGADPSIQYASFTGADGVSPEVVLGRDAVNELRRDNPDYSFQSAQRNENGDLTVKMINGATGKESEHVISYMDNAKAQQAEQNKTLDGKLSGTAGGKGKSTLARVIKSPGSKKESGKGKKGNK